MSNWFSGGKAVDTISVNDRGFQYGDGLFETIAIRSGGPRFWSHHMDRLSRGCELLRISMPAEQELSDGVLQALAASNVPKEYAVAKIIVSAGIGQRGYGRPNADEPLILYGAFASSPAPARSYEKGIDAILCNTRLASNSQLAGLKTLNRLEQVLARSEVTSINGFEGLTMDADDRLICGTMSNVFFVNNSVLSTPPVDRSGVAGIMRRHVMLTLEEQGVEVEVRHTSRAELQDVDEVFLTNSQFGIIPIRSCMKYKWPVGEVTRSVMALLAQNGVIECRQ